MKPASAKHELTAFVGTGFEKKAVCISVGRTTVFDKVITEEMETTAKQAGFCHMVVLDVPDSREFPIRVSVDGVVVHDGIIHVSNGAIVAVSQGFDGMYRLLQGHPRKITNTRQMESDIYADVQVNKLDLEESHQVFVSVPISGHAFISLGPGLAEKSLRLRGRGRGGKGDLYLRVNVGE
jgi:hypothetical protein